MPDPNALTIAALHERFTKLELDFDAVIRGLSEMNGTLGVHSGLLTEILESATAEIPESDLGAKLDRIAEALEAQTMAMTALDRRLTTLPDEIGRAFAEAM